MQKKAVIILVAICLVSCKFAEKESYLFPDGFIGNAIMFTNVKKGMKKDYDQSGRRVYLFPANGILISQFIESYGVIDKDFFYETKDRTHHAIKGVYFRDDINTLDTGRVYAFYGNGATITFPGARDTIGVQVVTICTPTDFAFFKNDLFIKRILGVHFTPAEINYERLLQLKKNPVDCCP